MRKRSFLFAVLTFATLCGCGDETKIIGPVEANPPGEPIGRYSRYGYEEYGFYISFPEGWTVTESANMIQAFTSEYRRPGEFIENANIGPFPQSVAYTEQELDDMFQQFTEVLESTNTWEFRDFREIENGKMVIDNHIVRWRLSSHRVGTVPIKGLQYWFVDGRRFYALTCSADPDRFSAYRGIFENIAKSFRFS